MQSASFFIHDLSTLYVPCLVLIVYALIGNSDLELQLYHRECQPAMASLDWANFVYSFKNSLH